MKRVLVTGGAGYIGGHTALALIESGIRPVVLDNLSQGQRAPLQSLHIEIVEGDISDRPLLDALFRARRFDAVMHFAAHAYVSESLEQPAKYYRNNLGGTLVLLDAMIAANVGLFVFSSSCATYGVPEQVPISESAPQRPINPYGRTKLMVEEVLRDYDRAYGLRSVVLRYFNAAGADPAGRIGETHEPETHLIPRALLAAMGIQGPVQIFGLDYATPDGTAIRDYVHVSDLAEAHVAGFHWLLKQGTSETFNLGNGQGYSVLDILKSVQRVTGQVVPTVPCSRREGDPPLLLADSSKARTMLNWTPRFTELDTIIAHAWKWHAKLNAASTRAIQPETAAIVK